MQMENPIAIEKKLPLEKEAATMCCYNLLPTVREILNENFIIFQKWIASYMTRN